METQTKVRDFNLATAAIIVFSVNLIIALWLFISPNLKNIDAADAQTVDPSSYTNKMSPFTEVIDTHQRARAIRPPEKLRPVLFQEYAATQAISPTAQDAQ